MILTGSNALNGTPIRKGTDTTPDQQTIMDKDLYEHYIWRHLDASNKPKLGKTNVTLFQEKIWLPEDVYPSLLGHHNKTNFSLLGLTAGTDLKESLLSKTVR